MSAAAKKILIVDDEKGIVEGIQSLLEAYEWQTSTASNGLEALEKIRTERPDLIILDVLMPQMSGLQFVNAIKETAGDLKRIPIILISARPSMEQFFGSTDIECFLSKPFKEEELVAKITKSLARHIPSGENTPPKETLAEAPLSLAEGKGKKVVVIGVEEFAVRKLKGWLESNQYEVELAMTEKEAVRLAEKFSPRMVLAQFWEDDAVLDTPRIYQELYARRPAGSRIPFTAFCRSPLVVDAQKHFPRQQILSYADTSELIQKISALLKTTSNT